MKNIETNFRRGKQLQASEVISYLENGGFVYIGQTEWGTFYLYKLVNGVLLYFSPTVNDWVESSLIVTTLFESSKFEAIQTEWFDNIPEHGTLCRVWDYSVDEESIEIVVRYENDLTFKFKTVNEGFKHAVPLTDAEIDEYFKRGQ